MPPGLGQAFLGKAVEKISNKEFYTLRGYEMIKKNNDHLTPSMEDYLEMIYRRCREEGYTRVNQLAEQLNVKAPSASKTVGKLAAKGYLDYEKYGIIQLTAKGEVMGSYLLERHETVEVFLKNIGVTDRVFQETELIEHYLSIDTVEKIKIFNCFMDRHPMVLEKLHQFMTDYDA